MSESNNPPARPAPRPSWMPLNFYWLIDISAGMAGEKLAALNQAIRNALPAMQEAAAGAVGAKVFVRTLLFGSSARWLEPEPISLDTFTWTDIIATDGACNMGSAFSELAKELGSPNFYKRGYRPALALVSNGQPTDDYSKGLKEIMALHWGKKAHRVAILLGDDDDKSVLEEFIGFPRIPVMHAHNAELLAKFIRFYVTSLPWANSSLPKLSDLTDSEIELPHVPEEAEKWFAEPIDWPAWPEILSKPIELPHLPDPKTPEEYVKWLEELDKLPPPW